MIKVKKYALPAVIILSLLAGIFILPVIMMNLVRQDNGEWSFLGKLLCGRETIIDAVRDKTMVYSLISREGRSDYGDFFVVFEQDPNQKWRRTYENDFTGLKPWKIELGDIDGDGVKEIFTAVRKTTHFDPVEKNRMFIFNYKDNKLIKKWTGSQIAGVWSDFLAGDLLNIPGDELIFIEKTEEEKERISIYYWFDFGFMLLAQSDSYPDIRGMSILGENRLQINYDGGRTTVLTVKDGKIIEGAFGQ